MSLSRKATEKEKKEIDINQLPPSQKRRVADAYREAYTKSAVSRSLKEAEFKSSMGMELSQDEAFLMDHKDFFKGDGEVFYG